MNGEVPPRPAPPAPLTLAIDSRIPVREVAATTADYDRYFHIARQAPDLTSWTCGVLRLQAAVLTDLPHTGLDDSQRAAVLTGLLHASHATLAAWLPSVPGYAPDGSGPGHPAPGISDFPASVYANDVRPTMEPPFAAPGFSGVLNQEHRVMTERTHALRTALGDLSATTSLLAVIRHEETLLRAAQRRNRKAHAAICERCVPDGASLLLRHTTRQRSGRATCE